MAFLVTHNSFSHSPNIAVWARNQRFSVSQQLKDGVRGLMLDIYPGKLNKRPYFVLKGLVRRYFFNVSDLDQHQTIVKTGMSPLAQSKFKTICSILLLSRMGSGGGSSLPRFLFLEWFIKPSRHAD